MDLVYIQNIRQDLRNWKVKVIVYDKTQPRLSPSSPNPYQRIILMDETKVVSTIYGKDIKKIGDKLQLYKTYIISNAVVNLQDTKYNIFGYPYQWTLKSFTKTRYHRERIIHPFILKFRFASLQKKGQHHVNIRGEQMLKKDTFYTFTFLYFKLSLLILVFLIHILISLIIKYTMKKIVRLTLWNNIAMSEGLLIDNFIELLPVIRATGLAISAFEGGSLGSTSSTVVTLNPQIPEGVNLYLWRSRYFLDILNSTMNHRISHAPTNTRRYERLHVVTLEREPNNGFADTLVQMDETKITVSNIYEVILNYISKTLHYVNVFYTT
ncbi:hypothetical protein ACJIZ3_014247 [Penstemon smallii]|uniref:Uncharacterized protein n=1 Tax=Penstemon smallii TaxID=265156 RepID=A0ABD3RJ00_9LAMI